MTALWTPSHERATSSRLYSFMSRLGVSSYPDLHALSVQEPGRFWEEVWDYCQVKGHRGSVAVESGNPMREAKFFPDARLNVVDTLLSRHDDGLAVVFRGEAGHVRNLTWAELNLLVSQYQQLLRDSGVEIGDRVAAMMANTPDIYAVMLAAASVGAVFTSVSPDFGTDAAIDRFGQIEPKVLFVSDRYFYGGKEYSVLDKTSDLAAALPTAHRTLVVPYEPAEVTLDPARHPTLENAAARLGEMSPSAVETVQLAFDHPWYVLYSSGTTGKPKCIVHRSGGVLLKHLVEHQLQCDVQPDDRVFYFTTAGWMMWNWLASGLASDATIVLYDGSPFHPDGDRLFDLADDTDMTLMGVSAKFIDACNKAQVHPATSHQLSSLRTICSTGSPLVPEGFEYVYSSVKNDVHLASISGGTDLCGCLVAGDPTSPVFAGEIQRAGLGMDIRVVDETGEPTDDGVRGELACGEPFPSMPLGFWNDDDNSKYDAAYFDRFPGLWHQGDYAEWTPNGGMVIHGRSDATLNPGGVRIGTAEIYRQVDALPGVLESLVVGQEWDGDTRVVLFVRLDEDVGLDHDLRNEIRNRIRSGASPRHVPAVIVAVPDLPRTRSGKLTELAVREIVHGREVDNVEALANPESLEHFRDLPELRMSAQ
ncbi:MAG: acetoacetate--CoA ligase [Acidimicrobiales bacterium]